jgi:pyruvate,water dikinase
MSDIRTFEQICPDDLAAVGGKGLNLAILWAAGLPVPPGFCVTTAAYRRLLTQALHVDEQFRARLREAYHSLGSGKVAVRSSAVEEDSATASFAGQQETILGVEGEVAILHAIARCWASLHGERAEAYRRRQGADHADQAMAVVIQRLVPAEVAGVLFTRDPLHPEAGRILVEASWGLGESVVSGRVTPDRFYLDRQTGAVVEQHIHAKTTLRTASGSEDVAAEKQSLPCLDEGQLSELAELGRRVETVYGDACDVEWAWANGRPWLLQARPITGSGAAEREQIRREEIAALVQKADPRGTVWSRYNLSETLPEPTPMTWALVRRFLSGKGGLGLMYRDLGFEPDPALDEEGIYDLICGRPYCNLSREPRMYSQGLPLEHAFALLKASPEKALYPQAQFNWSRAGWRSWLMLPVHFFKSMRLSFRLATEQRRFAKRFRAETIPAFAQKVALAGNQDLSALPPSTLLEALEHWIRLTLCDFARESLRPTVLAAYVMALTEKELAKHLGSARAKAALCELSIGARPDPEADFAEAIRDLAAGKIDHAAFLERFGHRGSQEMELASPRWAEDPAALERLTRINQAGCKTESSNLTEVCERLAEEAGWTGQKREDWLEGAAISFSMLHTFLGLRETAKHYLMQGYYQIRRILVELDRRYHLGGGIFYLLPEELPALVAGENLFQRMTARRRRRALALTIDIPPVLFSDDLEAIGRPMELTDADSLQGIPLSVGVAEGPALVLEKPEILPHPREPYILICPSTDPAWVPLFVHARGLIMETGGVLSHGAIVAREFGLPAVAGLPGILRRFRNGQPVRVDGNTGTVTTIKTENDSDISKIGSLPNRSL